MTNPILTLLFPLAILFSNCGQTQSLKQQKDVEVGGPCDGCDVMYDGMPPAEKISNKAILASEKEPGERMEIQGAVFEKDGKTPAKNSILYVYHTDAKGLYTPSATQTAGRRNGRLRGWVKTDEEGKFTIFSIRPAAYPNANIPAHIHILVKEPGKIRYYIDEVWFDDDPFVTKELKARAEKRGGDLLIHLTKTKGVWKGNLPIILGLHIPGYQ